MENEGDSYLESYSDIAVQKLMLQDEPRTLAYKNAIFANIANIEGKIVLDVGCGTGILSIFCAQAGARKVHAVECSSMAKLAKKVVAENGFEPVITVHECRVEELDLAEQVDVIISEWMGFYLLHEGMLPSVIFARDKFLKPDGLMFPDTADIWAAGCELPDFYEFWNDVYGVKMKCIGELDSKKTEPAVCIVPVENIITEPVMFRSFEMKTVTSSEVSEVTVTSLRPAVRNGNFNGICLWFHVTFPSDGDEVFSLKTGPGDPDTHWKQTAVLLGDEKVSEGDPTTFFEVKLSVREGDARKYNMAVSMVDATEVEHEVPCDCFSPKCTIIRSYIEGQVGNDNEDYLEEEEPEY